MEKLWSMKKEILEKWVQALRSGEYEQGTRALKNYNKYCCLGVLCDLARKEGVGDWITSSGYETPIFQTYNSRSEAKLPSDVVKWAGLKHHGLSFIDASNPAFKSLNNLSLAELNDGLQSFEYIAKVIEENIEGVE